MRSKVIVEKENSPGETHVGTQLEVLEVMSFARSVIIPLSVFEKCNFNKETDNILTNENLPSSEKMMLYQQKFMRKRKNEKGQKLIDAPPDTTPFSEDILTLMPSQHRPVVENIIKIIKKHPEDVRWNDNYEVILNNRLLPDTNIQDILHYLLNTKVITSSADIPPGMERVKEALVNIDVPSTWFRRKSPRSKKPSQSGRGKLKWAKWKL